MFDGRARPIGAPVPSSLPAGVRSLASGDDEWGPSSSFVEADRLRRQFQRDGFVLIRGAVPRELCAPVTRAFIEHVQPDTRFFFMRHESSRLERHVFTEGGFMKYPIMNIQDLPKRKFGQFRRHSLAVLTHPVVQQSVAAVLGGRGRLIHTMYFDGNQETWAHRDGHYIDGDQPGSMVGVWVALEDINPGAGRFYVVRGSHRTAIPGELDGAASEPNGPAYKALIANFVREGPLERTAPVMNQGDMLIWSSLTIHGSLPTETPASSRRSLTGHYMLEADRYRWFNRGTRSDANIVANGVKVAKHGQYTLARRLKAKIKADYPLVLRVIRASRAYM